MIRAKLAKTGDDLGTLQRYRLEDPGDTRLLLMSSFLKRPPVAGAVDPGVRSTPSGIFGGGGLTAILSDEDAVFTPRKIGPCRLWNAVDGRVQIYFHQEERLDVVAKRYPIRR